MKRDSDTWCRERVPLTDEYKVCMAGVEFRVFGLKQRDSLPCLGRTEKARYRCPLYAARTPIQIEDERIRERAELERVQACVDAVKAVCRVGEGAMPCPVCGVGTLSYRRFANGNTRGACSMAGCVRWGW